MVHAAHDVPGQRLPVSSGHVYDVYYENQNDVVQVIFSDVVLFACCVRSLAIPVHACSSFLFCAAHAQYLLAVHGDFVQGH